MHSANYSVNLRGLAADEIVEAVAALIDEAQSQESNCYEILLIDAGANGGEIDGALARLSAKQVERRRAALIKVRALVDTQRGPGDFKVKSAGS
jgi:hypothetical protein